MHSKALKSAAIVVASAATIAALTGCSTGSTSGEKALTMWTYSSTGAKGLEAAAAQYKKDTGVQVDIKVTSPREAYTTKIQAAARSKTLPDIITVGTASEDFQDAASGITIDLTKYVDTSWKSDFLPGMIDSATLTQTAIDSSKSSSQNSLASLKAGSIYGIPYLAGSSGVIVANKKLLAAAGIPTDKGPATWEEFVKDVKATYAKDSASGGLLNGLQTPEGAYQWLYRPMAAHYLGADQLVAMQSKAGYSGWTSADGVKTLEFYDQLQPYWAKGVMSLGLPEADTAFAQGQGAWDVGGTYTVPSVVDQGLKLDDLLMFPVPAPEGSAQPKASLSAIALLSGAVTSQSKDPAAAVKFLKYLSSPAGAVLFSKGAQDVSATKIDPAKLKDDPVLAAVVGTLSTDTTHAFNPDDTSADPVATPPIKHNVAVELAKLVTGTAKPDEVAANIESIYRAAWNAG